MHTREGTIENVFQARFYREVNITQRRFHRVGKAKKLHQRRYCKKGMAEKIQQRRYRREVLAKNVLQERFLSKEAITEKL